MAEDEKNEKSFSIGKLPTYSPEQIQNQLNTFQRRAQGLLQLSDEYDRKLNEAINSRNLPQAKYYEAYAKLVTEMADDAAKKVMACQIELELRRL